MSRMNRRMMLGLGVMTAAGLVPAMGQDPKPVPVAPGQPLNITVTTAAPAPDVSIVMGPRSGKVVPVRTGCTHTGGGNIDVQQPSPDTLVVTMSGVAVAYGSPFGGASAAQVFDLCQQFEVSFDKPTVKAAKLTIEGRVIGFLRAEKLGTADECASATLAGPTGGLLALQMPNHSVCGGETLGVNDKEGPVGVVIPAAGKFSLTQSFRVSASMPKTLLHCKAPSAEFAPDPALDPLWISYKEPFKGASKKDLGFQVIVKVAPEDVPPPPANGK
jgi:hypothetical protein